MLQTHGQNWLQARKPFSIGKTLALGRSMPQWMQCVQKTLHWQHRLMRKEMLRQPLAVAARLLAVQPLAVQPLAVQPLVSYWRQ
jgi:hypothetical protein